MPWILGEETPLSASLSVSSLLLHDPHGAVESVKIVQKIGESGASRVRKKKA